MMRRCFAAQRFEELSLPLAMVATDLGTGEPVVFRQGDLVEAIRASCAFPGLFEPVKFEGRCLADESQYLDVVGLGALVHRLHQLEGEVPADAVLVPLDRLDDLDLVRLCTLPGPADVLGHVKTEAHVQAEHRQPFVQRMPFRELADLHQPLH
jgi:predicted acylesterase/phospholipase RssA